jgi:hypothetical protein
LGQEDRKKWLELDKEEQSIWKKISGEVMPSLVIASTMDMEFAHIDGYEGKTVYYQNSNKELVYKKRTIIKGKITEQEVVLASDEKLLFQNWDRQIEDTEAAIIGNPLRLFPLFSYDPRRYRWPIGYSSNQRYPQVLPVLVGGEGCGPWIEPFEYIIGHDRTFSGINKIWIGFEMNPLLGFRPFDELCEYLPDFYKECEDKKIPIHAHCAPEGLTTHDAVFYKEYDENDIMLENRAKCNVKWHESQKWPKLRKSTIRQFRNSKNKNIIGRIITPISNKFAGVQDIIDSNNKDCREINHFYKKYGHPRNWDGVLDCFPNLHLCLAGFGGNCEWKHKSMVEWSKTDLFPTWQINHKSIPLPPRERISYIIKLTYKYPNVYADISGLNIYDDDIRRGLMMILRLIVNNHEYFKHLKYKLIFGSGWYLMHLIGESIVNAKYDAYCEEIKNVIVDNASLWEHISLINPRRCYALSQDRICEMYKSLSKQTKATNDLWEKRIIAANCIPQKTIGSIPMVLKPILYKKNDYGNVVLEINIRLAGFGGMVKDKDKSVLPTREFTNETELAVKQFQRDYMKKDVKEQTGFVDYDTLIAIDDFCNEYREDLDNYKCQKNSNVICETCGGFGLGQYQNLYLNNRKGEEAFHKYEYPGMHQSLLWAVSAVRFYTGHYYDLPENQMQSGDYRFQVGRPVEHRSHLSGISTGYRCWEDNKRNNRTTTNHMGKAVDIVFEGIPEGDSIKLLKEIFAEIFVRYLKVQMQWTNTNRLSSEPFGINTKEGQTSSWIHMDIRTFDPTKYLKDEYFIKSKDERNFNRSILEINDY